MKSTHPALLTGLALLALASSSNAQVARRTSPSTPDQPWTRQLGTSAADVTKCVTPDGSGGVYAFGSTQGSLGGPTLGGADVWIARYDGGGNLLWTRQIGTANDEKAESAAPDGAGGVFVCGSTTGNLAGTLVGSSDAWVARYDGAGNQLWIRQLDLPGDETANAMAPDGAGGVFLCGRSFVWWHFTAAWLARYDAAGNQIFFFEPGSPTNEFRAAASDGSGGVWVITHAVWGVWTDWVGYDEVDLTFLSHYDGAGGLLASDFIGSSYSIYDPVGSRANALAPDGAGGVYVAGEWGYPADWLHGVNDAWLKHWDANASLTWSRNFATSADDRALAVAADGSGGAYVGGTTFGTLAGTSAGGQWDAWYAHVDATGNTLSLLQFGTTSEETLAAAAPDGSGGVFLGGSTRGSLAGPIAGLQDAWIARFP